MTNETYCGRARTLDEIKELETKKLVEVRNKLKEIIDSTKTDSREMSLFITNLEQACMWLGKAMTLKGIFKPYTDEQQRIK